MNYDDRCNYYDGITLVGYIGGFSYFMIRVFKKERSKSKE